MVHEMNQKEIAEVSGGIDHTLIFANLFGIFGTGLGFLFLLTKKNYYTDPKAGLPQAFSSACNNIFCTPRGLKGTIVASTLISGGLAVGTFLVWLSVKTFTLAKIINPD
jgi:hypothetical protein